MRRLLFFAVFVCAFVQAQFVNGPGGTGGGGGGGGSSAVASATYIAGTYYFPAAGGNIAANTTETVVQTPVLIAGSISNFAARWSSALGAGVTATFTFMDNTLPQTVTCPVNGSSSAPANITCGSTANFTTAVNDLIDIRMVVAGGSITGSVTMTWGLPGVPGATGATGPAGPAGPAPSGTGIVKVTSGVAGLAVAGTDYVAATSGSAPLKGNGAGGTASALASDIIGLWTGTCDATHALFGSGSCLGTVTSTANDTNVTLSLSGGVLTAGWTGTLAKARLASDVVFNDQANTYSTGLQSFSAVDLLLPNHASDPASCAAGQIEFNTVAATFKGCATTNIWTALGSGSGMVYPTGSGVPIVVSGTSWGTTVAAPTGTIVGTTDPQTLSSKTLVAPALGTPVSVNLANALGLPAGGLASVGADNIFGNFTASSAIPSTQAIPVCANDGAHALVYPSHTLTCGAVGSGSVIWSAIGNPTGNLTLSMTGDTSVFDYTSALADAFAWYNTTAATSSTSQSGPSLDLSCGNEWHAAASTKGCVSLQFQPGNGTDAASTIAFTHTGSATGVATTTFPGPVSSANNGVNSGVVQLVGNTTLWPILANIFSFIGPDVATFTGYGLQASPTGPSAAGVMLVGAPSSNVSQITYGLVPAADLVNAGVFTGDVSGTFPATTVAGINGVPLCSGFTPTNGQAIEYTTGGSPNPCYNAVTPSGGGGGSPGGSSTQIQYNNAGAFGGISQLTYSGTTITLGSGGIFDGSAGNLKIPAAAGFTATATDNFGINSTNAQPMIWGNGANAYSAYSTVNLGNGVISMGGGFGGQLTTSNFSAPGNTMYNNSGNPGVYDGGLDTALNGTLPGGVFRGADSQAGGGSSSVGGYTLVRGGNNAVANAASVAGSLQLQGGESTGTTQGLQGPLILLQPYDKGTTATQFNLECPVAATANTVADCPASPTNWLGAAEKVLTNTVHVAKIGSLIPINASSAVTLNHTVCAGSTAGQVTDSGGTSSCTSGQGSTVGIVMAVAGTLPAGMFGDGISATLSTTLPLIDMNPAGAAASGGGISALTGDVTASGSGSVAATVVQVEGAAIPTSATLLGTNSSKQLIATTTTGTGTTAVLSASPALTGTPTAPTQTAGDNSTDLATDAFVTTAVSNAIAAVNPAVAVLAATTANIPGTYVQVGGGIGDTYTLTATGTTTIDGVTVSGTGQRYLLKNLSTAAYNGVYTVTVVGTTGISTVFTRALDYDTPSDVNNTGSIPVQSGTVNGTTSWLLTSQVTAIGSSGSAITYAQFSLNPATQVTSAAALTNNAVVIGQGSQAEATISADTTTTHALFATAGAPAFRAIATGDLPTITVSGGGTGDTSVTAFAPILGGTTSTGAFQSSVAGTSGQVFVSQGASTKPTYIDFPERLQIPAANCNNTTAGAGWSIGSGGTVGCRAGTNNQGGFVTITDTSSTFAQFSLTIPEDWDTATNPYVRFYFSAASDTTNGHTVIPQVKVSCPTAGNGTVSDDATFSAAQSSSTVTFGASAVANGFYNGSNVQFGATQMSGCIAGGLMIVQVGRATDTATGNINFYSADVTFPRLLVVQAN